MTGRRSIAAAALAGALLAPAVPARAATAEEVAAFVRTGWIHGLPTETAAAFGAEALPVLLEMLADDAERPHWENIVTTLGAIGSPSATAPLLALLEERFTGEVDTHAWQALLQVPVALGQIGAVDSRAFAYLMDGTTLEGWRGRIRWTYPALGAADERELLLLQQSIIGLGESGRPEALERLRAMAEEISPSAAMRPFVADHLAGAIERLEGAATESTGTGEE